MPISILSMDAYRCTNNQALPWSELSDCENCEVFVIHSLPFTQMHVMEWAAMETILAKFPFFFLDFFFFGGGGAVE